LKSVCVSNAKRIPKAGVMDPLDEASKEYQLAWKKWETTSNDDAHDDPIDSDSKKTPPRASCIQGFDFCVLTIIHCVRRLDDTR
jgi:hypothetical protein